MILRTLSTLATIATIARGAIAVRRYARAREARQRLDPDEMEITTADGDVLVCRRVSGGESRAEEEGPAGPPPSSPTLNGEAPGSADGSDRTSRPHPSRMAAEEIRAMD